MNALVAFNVGALELIVLGAIVTGIAVAVIVRLTSRGGGDGED